MQLKVMRFSKYLFVVYLNFIQHFVLKAKFVIFTKISYLELNTGFFNH